MVKGLNRLNEMNLFETAVAAGKNLLRLFLAILFAVGPRAQSFVLLKVPTYVLSVGVFQG